MEEDRRVGVLLELGEHGLVFGPFVLERRIAVGGTAEVFLAHPKVGAAPAPRLVVKKLLPTTGEVEGDRYNVLEREAELHRRVKHPNVVTVYGAGMVRGEPYLAMEFVDGLDLYRALRRLEADSRRVPLHVAAHIAREVALALAACTSPETAQPVSQEVAAWQQRAQNVTIIRDDWGIPHIHGKTDADAVFGLMYAQAEDDFNRIETNFLNSQGRLAEAEGDQRRPLRHWQPYPHLGRGAVPCLRRGGE